MNTTDSFSRFPSWIWLCSLTLMSPGCEGNLAKNGLDPRTWKGTAKDPCMTVADCQPATECQHVECTEEGVCQYHDYVDSIQRTPNPCQLIVCNNGIKTFETLINGRECDTDGYCYQGECHSCTNGSKDGDEVGIDCGGQGCPKCPGEACSISTDCQSGLCVDGVCCNGPCSSVCYSCNVEGHEGTCYPVPQLGDDGNCYGSQTCDGSGLCRYDISYPCQDFTQCASSYCSPTGDCRLDVGYPCDYNNPGACYTNFCHPNTSTCQKGPLGSSCQYSAQCASGTCTSAKCQ